jgi:hypothetical protein
MNDLISRQKAIHAILGQPPETHYPSWYAAMVDEEPDASIVRPKTLDAMVQAAYKAGKEGRPLMVAINEEVTT